jgi:hypothetical protein
MQSIEKMVSTYILKLKFLKCPLYSNLDNNYLCDDNQAIINLNVHN